MSYSQGQFQLRPYQQEAVVAIGRDFAEHRSTLLLLPTGCGKTVVFCELIRQAVQHGQRALVLAHRDELLQQAADKLVKAGVDDVGIEKGRHKAGNASVVVASVQSMQRKRLASFTANAFGLMVIDEAHHSTAKTYRNVLAHFSGAKVLGVTATGDRMDGKGLGSVYDAIAYEYALPHAIKDGYLCPIRSRRVRVDGLDLSGVRTTKGDLNSAELSRLLLEEKSLHEVAAPLIELAKARPTVVFTADVAHAEAMAEVLCRYRPGSAQAVSGNTVDQQRRDTLHAFHRGEFQYLVNCALLTEGWDEPAVGCVAIARPTKSRALYTQMIGRGTRLHPSKDHALVLDFVGSNGRHRLISTADILAGDIFDDDVVEKARQIADEHPDVDDLEVLELARKAHEEEKLRAKVTAKVRFFAEEIDLFVERKPIPNASWATKPATERQLKALHKNGIPTPPELTAGEASSIIGGISKRIDLGLCTIKQARLLTRQGHKDAASLSKEEAGKLISRIMDEGRFFIRRSA